MGITDVKAPFIYKNATYEIKIVLEPEGKYRCYGIENRQTGVIEGYVSQLARAMYVADQFEKDLKVGINVEEEQDIVETALMAALSASKKPRSN